MVGTKSRSTGGYRRVNSGKMARHHIGIALDNHHLASFRDGPFRQIKPVEHAGLLVHRGFGSVQVLRTFIVVTQPPRSKAHGLSGDISNGPHHTTAETVIDPAVSFTDHSRIDQFRDGESLSGEVLGQRIERGRGKTDAKLLGSELIETLLGEKISPALRFWFVDFCAKKLLRGLVHLEKSRSFLAVVGCLTVLVMEGVAHPLGQPLH